MVFLPDVSNLNKLPVCMAYITDDVDAGEEGVDDGLDKHIEGMMG